MQTILSLIYCTTLTAQESTSNIKLKVEARADYNHDNHKKELNGLKGNIVDFKLEVISPTASHINTVSV